MADIDLDSSCSRTGLRSAILTGVLAALAGVLTWALVWTEINSPRQMIDWKMIAVLAPALVVCERLPGTWIRFGPIGVVTPIWMFGFGLLLLGSPSLAVGVAMLGAVVHSVRSITSATAVVHRVAGVAISLSTAGLVLFAMGVRGAITGYAQVPWDWAAAIVCAGLAILGLNAVNAAITMSIHRRISFIGLLRRGLGVRVTAEGAMLSLAPIWVIAIDFSLVLVPLLGITTLLVFRSTREALERSHEAVHDPLTGLANRRAFFDHLDDALVDARTSVRTAVLIMDLDGFKEINDRLGHQIGDTLLVEFADRLEQSLPTGAVAARLGGDEFAVLLLVHATDDEALRDSVARVHARLSHPLVVDGFPVTVGVSIGVACSPRDGMTARDLMHGADVAMYKAKRTRSAIELYDTCERGPQRGRVNLLTDLGDALRRHELLVNFQPQVRLSDGVVDTLEALVRWRHPEHGLVSPGEFVGLAEQTDLIGPITHTVLHTATSLLATAATTDARLAVNISARSLQEPDFADEVFAILGETRFPASRLELEVTERALVTNAERSRFTIERLRQAGVRIAIDDFGVGYSSFQTLRLLDVDRVKVDREFVQGLLTHPRDRLIVRSLVQLAHDLGLDVVAEGVESTHLWDAVAELECDVAQGYGIAVPMAFPELRSWLSSWDEIVVAPARARHPVRMPAVL
ncbi:MAG: putative bifunctional diguanylate cyclase/phosphodiesterase [Acidimicrobiia bacterium]